MMRSSSGDASTRSRTACGGRVPLPFRRAPGRSSRCRRGDPRPRRGPAPAPCRRRFPSRHRAACRPSWSRPPARVAGARILARPKSSTFTRSREPMKMLAGLMSRWMMPAVCAASSASAIWMPTSSSVFRLSGPAASRSCSVVPSRYSMTMNDRPSCSPMSWMVQMFVWFSADAVCASRANRLKASGSPRELVGDELERHRTAQPRIFGLVHDAHAAAAQLLDDAVVRERLTDQRIAAGLSESRPSSPLRSPASSRAARSIAGAPRNLSARSCAASSERTSSSSRWSPPHAWRR